LNFLWVIDLAYSTRLHHGGLLRYFNLSRELIAQGHSVRFAVNFEDQREQAAEWLESLKAENALTDFCELKLDRSISPWRRAAALLLPFGFHERAIRPFVDDAMAALTAAARRFPCDIVIVSSRTLIFAAHNFRLRPCIADFSDSATLYAWRELKGSLRAGAARLSLRRALDLAHFFFRERHSARRYAAGIVVSPVDKRSFDRFTDPRKIACIANGVLSPGPAGVSKIPHQILFSGVMNFPPNYQAALWFLDHVFPRVRKVRPDLTFVIAGAHPPQPLLARASAHVQIPGFVPDLNQLISRSALYVAPLISGGGFKNKVVEAIANGTFVIGTSLAAEFLEPRIRALMSIHDDPREMADAICGFFARPAAYAERLEQLRRIVADEFSWPKKAAELAEFARSVITAHPPA